MARRGGLAASARFDSRRRALLVRSRRAAHAARPPKRRPNHAVLRVAHPYGADWGALLGLPPAPAPAPPPAAAPLVPARGAPGAPPASPPLTPAPLVPYMLLRGRLAQAAFASDGQAGGARGGSVGARLLQTKSAKPAKPAKSLGKEWDELGKDSAAAGGDEHAAPLAAAARPPVSLPPLPPTIEALLPRTLLRMSLRLVGRGRCVGRPLLTQAGGAPTLTGGRHGSARWIYWLGEVD